MFKTEYIGTTGPGSDMLIYAVAMNRMLGTKIKLVGGYEGADNIYLAMESPEVDGHCGTAVSGLRGTSPHWFEKKLVRFLVQTAVDPGDGPVLKDVPMIIDRAKTDDERLV